MTAKSRQNADGDGSDLPKSLARPGHSPSDEDLEVELKHILLNVPPLIRLPKPRARCPFTSASRSGLSELVVPSKRNSFQPPVRGIYRKAHKDAKRGQWLIPSEGLFRYLLGLSHASITEYLSTAKRRCEPKQGRTVVP